jgi:hypothetical protein
VAFVKPGRGFSSDEEFVEAEVVYAIVDRGGNAI